MDKLNKIIFGQGLMFLLWYGTLCHCNLSKVTNAGRSKSRRPLITLCNCLIQFVLEEYYFLSCVELLRF